MKLTVGERLEGAGPAHQPGGYVVTAVVRETPWHGLYAAKKIFYNFDFTAKRVRETDEVEWLDVFLRTNRYPILDDPSYVQQRRALARAEVRAVLGNRHSNLWPEPLDLLEIENTRDRFTFADDPQRGGEPIVVYARPQGQFTVDWQRQILPISSVLSVLAELLEFMRQAHAEGLLLLGLGPASLLIDSSNRIHYVGTELVLSQQSALLKETTPAATWQRLFPADRFSPGFAAPECFDASKRPDVRADMYAWGALACCLLTGNDLGKDAQEQGRPWVAFTETHWSQLEKLLVQFPRNSLESWAEQIGVEANALLEDWPRKFLTVFRLLLSPEPARRPHSVAALLGWLVDPPPPPLAGFIAMHTDADIARLMLDCTGIEDGLETTIQCTLSTPARQPTDGTTVAEGPLRPVIGITNLPVTPEPIIYTAFTRRKRGGQIIYSPGVAATLWQPTAQNLRQWAEEQADAIFDAQPAPSRIGMVLGALEPRLVTETLIASPAPRVRAWGLRRVEQALRLQGHADTLEALLWRFMVDPSAELREAAATALWTHQSNKSDELLVRLIEGLEAPPLDAPIPPAHFLRQLQLPDERIRSVLREVELRRPTECPLCHAPLQYGERAIHLQVEHGYLLYQGDVLPADAVFARYWQRALYEQDRAAHDELIDMYVGLREASKSLDVAVERYVADLRKFVLDAGKPGADVPVAVPYAAMMAYQNHLRHSKLFVPIVRALLDSEFRRLCDLGVQAVLPYLQEQLAARSTVDELRRLLDVVCSALDHADLQIELCQKLLQLGVDQALVNGCIAQLQEERLVVCSECESEVKTKDLELHLRRAHEIFQFRGERRTYVETRAAILMAICAPPPDLAAWKSLQSLADGKHPREADRYLIVWLYQFLKNLDSEHRGPAITAATELLAAAHAVDRLLPIFVGPSKNASWELLGQRLALELCTRLSAPPSAPVLTLIAPFLDHKELPRRLRENAVLAMLRLYGKQGPLAADLLRAYVARSSKKRGIEKLHLLEQRFGQAPAIDAVTTEIDNEIRMSCPRCPTELRKKDMVGHLWDKHGLVLDGQRVREPWRVIEDWVVDYGLEKDPHVLTRCRDLARKEDPQTGLARLQRLLYRRGLRDRELLHELRAQVQARQATLCPHCCATVNVEALPVLQPLVMEGSRLHGFGYQLELSETGLIPALLIESTDTILFRGRAPGRIVTRFGGILAVIVPLIALMFWILTLLPHDGIPHWLMAAVAFGLGLIGAGFLYLIWPNPRPAKERLLKAAWKLLVPEMLQEKMGRREWSFLHGLVELSEDVGHLQPKRDVILECCEQASEAARTDATARHCLASLSRCCIADMRERGDDPANFILTLAAECFKGKLPLSVLSDLLENFHGKERSAWSKADLHRLPILLAMQAFAADVDIDDWLSLGRAFPVLNGVLNLEHRWHWLQVSALWHRKAFKPWENAGFAQTLFDLAQAPDDFEDLLSYYPDVLLYIAKANLVIGSKGVWIEGVCVTTCPPGVEIAAIRTAGGHELQVGTLRIRCAENPRPYLDDIKRWLRWYFEEFVPSVSNAPRPMTESRHRMWQLSKLACPDCTRPLVPCPGDLGVALK